MPRNPYISIGASSEQELMENLLIESIKIHAIECYYIPRKILRRDFTLNEVIESQFNDAFKIEMYIQDAEAFGGDGQFLSKFGLELRDQMTLVVARKRWEQLVGRFDVTDEVRPAEGDLIFVPMVQGLFEIKMTRGNSPFYQLQNLPTYTLTVEMYEFDLDDKFDTNIRDIDEIEEQEAQRIILTVGANASTFEHGEEVYQIVDSDTYVRGEIAQITDTTIHVTQTHNSDDSDLFWQVTAGNDGNLIGVSSDASVAITAIDNVDFSTDSRAQNEAFESDADDWIDFTETNPFGEINVWGEQ